MFCTKCGKVLSVEDKFCVECGQSVDSDPRPDFTPILQRRPSSFPWFIYLMTILIVLMVSFTFFMFINSEKEYGITSSSESDSEELEYEATLLGELEYSIEPVGYFDDMSLFESETMSFEEWYSHIKFYEQTKPEPVPSVNQFTNRDTIFSSVVKIVCEDEDYFYYGSGTNVDPSGYILTNHHVVENLPKDACMVGFPDPSTGLIVEAYWTTIIIDKDNETGHDLAYLAIDKPVFDEAGNVYGYHDKILNSELPYFEHTEICLDSVQQLGEKILVLGYPPLSGTALTVTDGLISSFYSPNGYIITSAKIVNGNSGGLAINENGCYVGVPTAFYYDTVESEGEVLGEIIDWEFVTEFDLAIEDDLEDYYIERGMVDYSIPESDDESTIDI